MNMAFSSNMYVIQNKCLPEDGLLAQNMWILKAQGILWEVKPNGCNP
jgi:hypothetical protein